MQIGAKKSLHFLNFRFLSTFSEGEGLDFRLFLTDDHGKRLSFWKDLPLYSSKSKTHFTGVFEIPSNRLAKFELDKGQEYHPIIQDYKVKKDKTKTLRYYSLFRPFNYGFIPKTWENNLHPMPGFDFIGDGDPVDIIELGEKIIGKKRSMH